MTEEIKEETEEEVKPTFLEEVRKERIELEQIRADLRELRADEILSGKADVSKPAEKEEEESPQDYAKKALQGKI